MHPGLCKHCAYARKVANRAGSEFWLCQAHKDHPEMPKYPPLPVLRCHAFQPDRQERASRKDSEVGDGN